MDAVLRAHGVWNSQSQVLKDEVENLASMKESKKREIADLNHKDELAALEYAGLEAEKDRKLLKLKTEINRAWSQKNGNLRPTRWRTKPIFAFRNGRPLSKTSSSENYKRAQKDEAEVAELKIKQEPDPEFRVKLLTGDLDSVSAGEVADRLGLVNDFDLAPMSKSTLHRLLHVLKFKKFGAGSSVFAAKWIEKDAEWHVIHGDKPGIKLGQATKLVLMTRLTTYLELEPTLSET